jgi:hypothetical protein
VPGVTLDTGALIAIDRGDRRLQALLDEAGAAGAELAVPAGVIAQAWRGSARQARLARFLALSTVTVVALDEPEARASSGWASRPAQHRVPSTEPSARSSGTEAKARIPAWEYRRCTPAT